MKSVFSILTLFLFAGLFLSAGSLVLYQNSNPESTKGKAIIAMREIGHQVLLDVGDSASRVLPVKEIAKNTFQIEFQSPFTFNPDSLVQIVHRSLTLARMPLDYRVNVINCAQQEIIFGYEMHLHEPNVVPCIGRTQPFGCYLIQLTFLTSSSSPHYLLWLTGGVLLVLLGIYWFKNNNSIIHLQPIQPTGVDDSLPTIGKYRFDQANRLLRIEQGIVELSEKEAQLLAIFANSPNQTLTRDNLLKAVWEDEGVFVGGRTLDVFISKLRKKLQKDPALKITNIHKKGYRLEIG